MAHNLLLLQNVISNWWPQDMMDDRINHLTRNSHTHPRHHHHHGSQLVTLHFCPIHAVWRHRRGASTPPSLTTHTHKATRTTWPSLVAHFTAFIPFSGFSSSPLSSLLLLLLPPRKEPRNERQPLTEQGLYSSCIRTGTRPSVPPAHRKNISIVTDGWGQVLQLITPGTGVLYYRFCSTTTLQRWCATRGRPTTRTRRGCHNIEPNGLLCKALLLVDFRQSGCPQQPLRSWV